MSSDQNSGGVRLQDGSFAAEQRLTGIRTDLADSGIPPPLQAGKDQQLGAVVAYRHVDADRHKHLTAPDGTPLANLRLSELRVMFAYLAPSPTTTKSELLDLYAASLKRGGA